MTQSGPSLDRFLGQDQLRNLIQIAKTEDMGPDGLDLTTASLLPKSLAGRVAIRCRQEGILAGAAVLPSIIDVYDPSVSLNILIRDSHSIADGATVAEMEGEMHSILAMERVALNLMSHLSGIATLTARYVDAVEQAGCRATKIYDTRKTLPGLRAIQKYAVACGGGHNHRDGLHDAILIKDNHIAHYALHDLPEVLQRVCQRVRTDNLDCKFIEVEVDTLPQLDAILRIAVGQIDVVLLDNMSPDHLCQAVVMRNRLAPSVQLEASGGVNIDTVVKIARSGVNRISVGQLTHSAPALDLAIDIL